MGVGELLSYLDGLIGSPSVQVGSLVVCLVCLVVNLAVAFDWASFSVFGRRGRSACSTRQGTVYIAIVRVSDARTRSGSVSGRAPVSRGLDVPATQVHPPVDMHKCEPVYRGGSGARSTGGRL